MSMTAIRATRLIIGEPYCHHITMMKMLLDKLFDLGLQQGPGPQTVASLDVAGLEEGTLHVLCEEAEVQKAGRGLGDWLHQQVHL